MSLLVIRAHKRFAVRREAWLSREGECAAEGLIIELSLEGCRISNLAASEFTVGEPVTIRIDDAAPIEGRVRWTHEKTLGLRFEEALHCAALDRLIRICRGETADGARQRSYGT